VYLSDWGGALTRTSHGTAGTCWPPAVTAAGCTEEPGLMTGVLAALRSSSLDVEVEGLMMIGALAALRSFSLDVEVEVLIMTGVLAALRSSSLDVEVEVLMMTGVLAALRSSSLSTDEQQRRLNAMIVELQQLRRNLETSPASVLSTPSGYRNSPVSLTKV